MKIGLFLFPIWSVKLPPLGVAYVASALREQGHNVVVRDYNLEIYKKLYPENAPEDGHWYELGNKHIEYSGELGKKLINLVGPFVPEVVKEIAKENFDIIGVSLFTSSMKFTELALRVYRAINPDTKIIIGGPSSTRADADFFLRHGLADYVVYGEGEKIMCELVGKIQRGEDFRDTPSIKYLGKDGEIVITKRKSPMTPEEFSLPDFSDYNIRDYTYKAIPIMMSRGCVAACAFCNETHYWHRYRMGIVENIGRELNNALRKYDYDFVFICDSLVNGNHDLLEHLVDFVLENKLQMNWGGNARFDAKLNLELLTKMKEAGCYVLTFGLESASEKVLKMMGKRITMDVVKQVLDDCEKVGIKANVNILVGFPGEEEEDFQITMNFLREHRHQLYVVNTGFGMEINENTGVYRQPTKYNILLDEDGKIGKYQGAWATADLSNTIEIRKERIKRLRDMLVEERMTFREEKLHAEEYGFLAKNNLEVPS